MSYNSLNLKDLDSSGVAIIASSMVNDKLAKVIISYSGKVDRNIIARQVSNQLKGLGSIVESSFRPLEVDGLGKMAVGYVRANREVRMPTDSEIKANYRVLSSNILRSNEDRSLWEIKKGKNTTYLARHGNDDLSELVGLCTASAHPTSCVTLAVQASVKPENYDFVSFVNEFGEMDYGFVVSANTKQSKVVAYSNRDVKVVDNSAVVDAMEIKIDPLTAKAVKQRVMADTKDGSTADMVDYYRELFSYDEEYMDKFIDDVKQMSKEIA